VVRLLDLVSDALAATANGAQPRIQLELVLIKATAPEVDPSAAALLARIERLEAALAGQRPAPTPVPAPAAAPVPETAAAPVPETAAAPTRKSNGGDPAPPPAGPPELATVTACWPAVIDLLNKDNQLLASSLAAARPVSLNGEALTIAFPTDKPFYLRKAEQDENRRATAEALRAVIGTVLALRYELRDEPEPADPAAEPGGLSHEELVKRLVEEFDAQEVLDDDEETD
jgi:DNA polymerase III subunit gamma/tau